MWSLHVLHLPVWVICFPPAVHPHARQVDRRLSVTTSIVASTRPVETDDLSTTLLWFPLVHSGKGCSLVQLVCPHVPAQVLHLNPARSFHFERGRFFLVFLKKGLPDSFFWFFFPSFFNEVFYEPVLQVRHQVMKWFWSMGKPGNILGIFGPMIINRCGVVLGALLFFKEFWQNSVTS